jgi:hypothetical protein
MKRRRAIPRRRRPDGAEAFLPDPEDGGRSHTSDVLAEALAEEFLKSATSAEEAAEAVRDAVIPEEVGGPFVEVRASTEFDRAADESNPPDAVKEPFPRAMRAPYR